jgi:hypothetical protein
MCHLFQGRIGAVAPWVDGCHIGAHLAKLHGAAEIGATIMVRGKGFIYLGYQITVELNYMPDRYLSAEGMRNWAQLKKLENERHSLERKIMELTKKLSEVEEEIHKLGGL